MPELPEVETVRAGLASLITGTRIERVEILRDSCVRLAPGGPGEFTAAVSGMSIAAVVRRGKFLWLELVESDAVLDAPLGAAPPVVPLEALSAHLGMSGQFRVHPGAQPPEPHSHCRARLHLSRAGAIQSELGGSDVGGSDLTGAELSGSDLSGTELSGAEAALTLDFIDQRTFGYLHAEPLVPTPDHLPGGQGSATPSTPASVAHIARDALDPDLPTAATARALRRGTRGIKQVLLDQQVVSGIGNIYADEALWLARIHPERPAHAVTSAQARALLEASQQVMREALAQGGTSFDALYVNVNGESGYFSRSLRAYGRAGEPCLRCGRPLRRASIGGRSTHWCATCQRRWAPRRS